MDNTLGQLFSAQLQRVVNLSTQEAAEIERSQRLNLLHPALESLKQSDGQQQAQGASFTPQRANVLLRPLAAAAAEHVAQDPAHATPALPADAAKASAHPTPATGAMLPTPLLMTPAGATLLQTPDSSAAWGTLRPGDAAATLGLSPAVALAGAGVRPVAAFPHFLSGVMATPMLQQRPGRPGEQQQAAEADDGKLSKKRQGYHIEPAALQKLIEKQQLEAQRKQEQQQGGTAAGNSSQASRAAAAAAAGAMADKTAEDPPPRQQQQQHRPRVLSRLPPQVREQAERQAAERARKQQEEAEAQAAGEAGSSRAQAAAGPGALSQQQMLTAADCLGSPDGSMGGLQLRVRDLDPQDMELEEPGKLFGSAQKRLRLSLCDDQGSPTRVPSSHPMVSPVELPTPSPAMVPAPTPAPALAGAAGPSSTAAQAAAAATASAEAPTPSKFFSGSPVPQAQRRAVLPQTYPDTPVALGQPPLKQEAQEVLLEPFRGGAQGPEGGPGQAEAGSSSWVPVPGQAPAVPGATPVPAGPPAAVEGDELLLDPAAAAAMPLPESPVPVKQVAAEPHHQQHKQQQQQGGGEGGPMLQTPQGQEQQGTATPVTGL